MTTPSQTVGPFFAIAFTDEDWRYVVPESTPDSFWVGGTVYDGDGQPVPDALVETWQADPAGNYRHPDDSGIAPDRNFQGFGRCQTDTEGNWRIHTVKPGTVPGLTGEPQSPHLAMTLLARGLLHRVVTRVYFADEAGANATDTVLSGVDADRRATLLAQPTADGYHLDIRLQGEGETVFFDV